MATPKKKLEYIGDEWFTEGRPQGMTRGPSATGGLNEAERMGDTVRLAEQMMQGAPPGSQERKPTASVSMQDDTEERLRQQAGNAKPQGGAEAGGAPAARQYAGNGGYLYEIRNGDELWIVGANNKMREPVRVTGTTPKGAVAYNAILNEIGADLARDGIKLNPVRVPSAASPQLPDAARQQFLQNTAVKGGAIASLYGDDPDAERP